MIAAKPHPLLLRVMYPVLMQERKVYVKSVLPAEHLRTQHITILQLKQQRYVEPVTIADIRTRHMGHIMLHQQQVQRVLLQEQQL